MGTAQQANTQLTTNTTATVATTAATTTTTAANTATPTTTTTATTWVTNTALMVTAAPTGNSHGEFFPIFKDGTTRCENMGTPPSWMANNVLKQTKSECCRNYAFPWDYEKCLGLVSSCRVSFASIDQSDKFFYPNFEAKTCNDDGNYPDWMAGDYLADTLTGCCHSNLLDEEC